jgi:membrane protease YdiL (CAAX protease family)
MDAAQPQPTRTLAATPRATTPFREIVARRPLVAYFALAFAGTWLVLLPAALSRGTHGLGLLPFAVPDIAAFLMVMLSAYTGPLLAAVVVTAATDGREGLRRLRRRIGLWRVGVTWYLVALLAPAAIWTAAYSIPFAGAPLAALARQWPLLFTAFLPNVAIGLLLPCLGEETGWRGFALPRLQRLHGPVVATIILGGLHSLWHLPAFFTVGLGPFIPSQFLAFILTGVAATFLYTWVFNNARGSILLAILLHSSFNAASNLVGRIVPTDVVLGGWARAIVDGGWLNVLAFGAAASLLVAFTRGRLGYQPERPAPQDALPHPTGGAVP